MSEGVGVLQEKVVELQAKVLSLHQSARAKKGRRDHHRPTRRKEGALEPTAEQLASTPQTVKVITVHSRSGRRLHPTLNH